MQIVIDVDIDKIEEEAIEKAKKHLEDTLTYKCTGAFRNAESQLDSGLYEYNFKYALANCRDPETSASISEIILNWVNNKFSQWVKDYIRKEKAKDIRAYLDNIDVNEILLDDLASRLYNSNYFQKRLADRTFRLYAKSQKEAQE